MLLDANTKFGNIVSDAVGDLAPDEENEVGEVLHQICLDNNVFLPSTFHEFHTGGTHSWTSSACPCNGDKESDIRECCTM